MVAAMTASHLHVRRIDLETIRVNVATKGAGPPILMLHGLGWDHTLWKRQMESLSDRFLVVAPDCRGHGLSDIPAGPYYVQDFQDDVLRLMDHLQLEKAALLGFSLGGATAMALTMSRPERVSSLVIACSVAKSNAALRQGMQDRIASIDREDPRSTAMSAAKSIFSESFIRHNPHYIDEFLEKRATASKAGLVASMRAGVGIDLDSGLRFVSQPTMVIAAEFDRLTPPDAVRTTAASIPGAIFKLIPDSGHMAPVEQPALFDSLLQDFYSTTTGISAQS